MKIETGRAGRQPRPAGVLRAMLLCVAAIGVNVAAQTSLGDILGTGSPGYTPKSGSGSSVIDLGHSGGAGTCQAPAAGPTSACGGSGVASQSSSSVNLGAGNPINLVTGNKYQVEVDMAPLPGELGLEVVCHYSSANGEALGLLGAGWKLSYETQLYRVGQTLQILQADGARRIFDINPRQPERCAGVEPDQGWVEVLRDGGHTRYVWHWTHGDAAGRQLHFNARGLLMRIVAASGAAVRLERAPAGHLLKVTDPQGRLLEFLATPKAAVEQAQRSGSAGVFAGVERIRTPLGDIRYQHGNGTDSHPANLVRVERAGHSRHYHYEETGWPHALTGISVDAGAGQPPQRLNTWHFDQRGRAIGSNAREDVRVFIEQPATPNREGRTLVSYGSAGQEQHTLYRHRIINGQYRLTEALGAACASCSPGNRRYRYDAQGRLIEITELAPVAISQGQPQGTVQALHSLRHTLDALGRTVKIESVGYQGGRETTRTVLERRAYADARWPDKPTLLARPSVVAGQEHQIRLSYNEAGQVTEFTETGYSPLTADGVLAANAQQASALQRSTQYRYQRILGVSLLVQTDGPLPNGPQASPQDSDITRLGWDAQGHYFTDIELPGGRRSQMRYTEAGLLSHVHNAQGHASDYRYNAQGQVIETRFSGPGWAQPLVQQVRYDTQGHPVEVQHPQQPGANWAAEWDAQGRPLWQATALGHWQRWHYPSTSDPASPPQSTSPRMRVRRANAGPRLGSSQQRWHDDFGRLVRTHSPNHGTQWQRHDQADRLASMQDALGHQARYQHDLQGRILSQTVRDARSQQEQATRWHYQGQCLVWLEHPQQSEHYRCDERGLRVQREVVLHGVGQAHRDIRAVTRYTYDDTGLLAATQLPDGSTVRQQRNGLGQLQALRRQTVQTPWLRWLAPEQTLAADMAHDAYGLSRYTAGNGIQSEWQRSTHPQSHGTLARLVHRRLNPPAASADHSAALSRLSPLLGLGSAHAQAPALAPAPTATADEITPASLPGALGLPAEPNALLDWRYLWDPRGNLLLQQGQRLGQREQQAQAYDRQAQLLASVHSHSGPASADPNSSPPWQESAVWRYAYDNQQRRLLDQQGAASQADTHSHNQRSRYRPGTHQPSGTQHNANGQADTQATPQGQRQYQWDALGRLVRLSQDGQPLAEYRYDHRGLRTAKHINGHSHYTVYDEARQPQAELNEQGQVQRLYVWLGHQPLAVIDTPAELTPAQPSLGQQASQVLADLGHIVRAWLGQGPAQHTVWLHVNHLGAPELGSDAAGQVIWQARYSPFGAAQTQAQAGFALNLRLPGQVFDEESGLHYNRQRYYDPQAGRYLSPDPLGHPDGPNPYAYVANNPLGYIDPDGLILFAFDGTNNANPPPDRDTLSNVYKFYQAYDVSDPNSGNGDKKWYMNGIGRDDLVSRISTNLSDAADGNTGHARVQYMLNQLDGYINNLTFNSDTQVNIDMVGFSRGAAMARDFSNRVDAWIQENRWQEKTPCVHMRFLGLWDTVAQFGLNGADNGSWQLAIPGSVAHVYQAVAMNENRYLFPGEAIGRGTQRGFVGMHADIGGSYGTGDLSDVALNWIVEQAKASGVEMSSWKSIEHSEWGIITNPVVHGKGADLLNSDFCLRENNERWADNCTLRKNSSPGGLTTQQIADLGFIIYSDALGKDADGSTPIVGTVNMEAYAKWLKDNYQLTIAVGP